MGRKVAIPWHLLFSIGAGGLYFLCVLPRWSELTGDTSRGLGMAGRIGAGALIALAALPVVFTHLRTRKPELGVPQMALTLRVWSIVSHVLAGVLIIGAAISEIWLSLDAAGQYLFGIYGAAAAIGLIGVFAFYLSFVAESPAPAPKPIKAKKPKRGPRRKKADEADDEDAADTDDEAADTEEAEAEAEDTDDAETVTAEEAEDESDEPAEEPVEATAKAVEAVKAEKPATANATDEATEDTEEPPSGLRNRRPEGKGSHRMRRRRTRGGVALDE